MNASLILSSGLVPQLCNQRPPFKNSDDFLSFLKFIHCATKQLNTSEMEETMSHFAHLFKDEVAHAISQALQVLLETQIFSGVETSTVPTDANTIFEALTVPPQFALGQVAFPCFALAKALKLKPALLAQRLSDIMAEQEKMKKGQLGEDDKENKGKKNLIKSVTPLGGYLNFHCHFPALGNVLFQTLKGNTSILAHSQKAPHSEKVVVEYSQPNTHKALHVGHLRCLFLGAAIANLLESEGMNVVRATYPGDFGTHVAKFLWYVLHRTPGGTLPSQNTLEWIGQMYANSDSAVKAAEGTSEENLVKQQLSAVLQALALQEGDVWMLYQTTREWSLEGMREVYAWLKTEPFDLWFYESECEKPSVELVQKKFAEGALTLNDGAIGIDLSAWNLGFALLLKSDGHGLYSTKDLELLRQKFSDPSVTHSIVVVDSRQKLHFKQVFKTAELLGLAKEEHSFHLPYETVNTPEGEAFSSRKLNALGLTQLFQTLLTKIKADYLARYSGQWSETELEETARDIAIGTLKYGLLRVDNGTQVTFLLEEWLRLDGDTGPYLQYVHARCKNILAKVNSSPFHNTPTHEKAEQSAFAEPAEQELLYLLSCFDEVRSQAAAQLRPSVLAGYLFDVGKSFNRFYESCPIKLATDVTRVARLRLVEYTAQVMKQGLALLGIPAPERM